MRKLFLLSVILLLFENILISGPVSISGKVINGKGMTIRLMTYSDQVSYLRETLQSAVIGEDELFSFTTETDSVKYCWLDVEFQQAELFIQSGQSYEIEIEIKYDPLSASYYNRSALPLKFIKDDDDRLNNSIQDFNQLYNDFLLNYSQNSRSGNSKSLYNNFLTAIDLRFQNEKNTFFLNYMKYKIASMQLFMRLKSRENIGLEYIADQPVLYNHLEYMDFFHLFFEKYFLTTGKYFTYNKSYDLINGTASASAILDSLQKDPVLKNLETRELLLLTGLKELYNVSGFKKNRVITLIEELKSEISDPGIAKLADNVVVRLKRLQPGSPAPDFALVGVEDGLEHKLSDYAGKKVYLAFFDSQNPASQSELGMINDIYDEFRNKVAFIAISVDQDRQALGEYLKAAELPWQILHYDGNIALLESYDASTFPYFILIGETGQVMRCPAPSPSENIVKLLN
jgi:peroxiredoxin